MENTLSEKNTCFIAKFINEVVFDETSGISQYEMLIDLLLATTNSHVDELVSDSSLLRDSIISLNAKILGNISKKCELFDEANPLDCFAPKYSINTAPNFRDYAELLVTILATRLLQIEEESLDMKYSGHFIKREFVTVLSRFMFLYNGHLEAEYTNEKTNYPHVFPLIISNTISILCATTWSIEELPQLRLFLLNLIDSIDFMSKDQVKTIVKDATNSLVETGLTLCEETISILHACIDKYYEWVTRSSNIEEIKVSWLYAYIYKKRFGFILCKKFAKSANASSLPYKFQAFSHAFKSGAYILVSNGPKVVLFEAGENKRSSEYVPTQSSAFYNPASGMFE